MGMAVGYSLGSGLYEDQYKTRGPHAKAFPGGAEACRRPVQPDPDQDGSAS